MWNLIVSVPDHCLPFYFRYYFLFPTCTNFVFTYFMAFLLLLIQLRFNAEIVSLIKGVNHKSNGQILESIFDTRR